MGCEITPNEYSKYQRDSNFCPVKCQQYLGEGRRGAFVERKLTSYGIDGRRFWRSRMRMDGVVMDVRGW